MRIKHSRDRGHWNNAPLENYNKQANSIVRGTIRWIDDLCKLLGWGDITLTSYFRPDDEDSYHSILQAGDIRSKDKPYLFKIIMGILGSIFKMAGSNIQIYVHRELWDKPQEHIHIAYKDGAINK